VYRWKFVLLLLLASGGVGACSGASGSDVPSSIGRPLSSRGAATRAFQVLHTFEDGRDGADPVDALLLVNGSAYGTTYSGGIRKYAMYDKHAVYNPSGTIFKIAASGKYSVLYRFAAHVPLGQRAYPDGALVNDPAGNFYGTTSEGGPTYKGTVYELSARGRATTLYTFKGGSDGEYPYAGLFRDARGNLYGTTEAGGGGCNGAGCGTVFKIDAARRESVVYAFTGSADGCVPYGGVVRDRQGNLYGTTTECGSPDCAMGYLCGIAFKIDPQGQETILYRFTNAAGGQGPDDSLLQGSDGDFYGTTDTGGTAYRGVVFKIDKHGNETVLYNFTGGSDGAGPFGGLIQDAAGHLYGTTEFGGGYSCSDGNGCGTVFELDTTGKETVLYRFTGKRDGMDPLAGLTMDSAGYLYGTTELGGDKSCNNGLGCGVAFKLRS
jgi:uncharacterized repeat protein (TIGR03803 family)